MHTSSIIPVVGAIIEKNIDGTKHVLIQTRWKPGTEYHGTYECPVGRIDQGESVFEGLQREVEEECGLQITHINTQVIMRGADTVGYTPVYCTQQLLSGLPRVLFGFVCHAEGTLSVQESETRDPQWITLIALKNLLDAGKIFDLEVPFFRYYLSIHDTITFESFDSYCNTK